MSGKHRLHVHDDGFTRSFRQTRIVCASFALFPIVFVGIAALYISRAGAGGDVSLLVALAAVLPLLVLPAARAVRGQIARAAIAQRLADVKAYRKTRAVYAVFGAACIAAFLVAEIASLLGLVGSVLTRSMVPLLVSTAGSYVMFAWMWPRRAEWLVWARDAGMRGAGETVEASETDPSPAGE